MISARYAYLPLVALLASCKVLITVPEGGKVVSNSGTYTCTQESPCEVDVIDFTFSETFVAMPDADYEFVAWKTREEGLCMGQSKPCSLSSIGLESFEWVADLLNSGDTYFLEPNFASKSDRLRTFNEGDTIAYKGTISSEPAGEEKISARITALQEFFVSDSTLDDMPLMVQQFTLRLNADGSEFPEASLWFQDSDGSWIDITDTSGNLLRDSETNEFGAINYRSPLATGSQETAVIELIDSQNTSLIRARANYSTEIASKIKSITVPLGKFKAYKVSSHIELEIPDDAAVATIIVDQVHWVVPYIGPVKRTATQRNYDRRGDIIETLKTSLVATQVNF